jgi:hypothetical protein
MRTWLPFIAAGILSYNSLAYAFTPDQNVENSKYALAQIVVTTISVEGKKTESNGTGFFFYKSIAGFTYFLTALHVVEKYTDFRERSIKISYLNVASNNLETCSDDAELIKRDQDYDLALLRTECKPSHILKVGDCEALRSGQRLDVIGWSGSQPIVFAVNNVKSLRKQGRYALSISNITHGESGAPALDENGKVIAIVTGGEPTSNTTATAAIDSASGLINYVMARDDKKRFEQLQLSVKKQEEMIEQLKQNVRVTPRWTTQVDLNTNARNPYYLIVEFHKDFNEQYLPNVINIKITPEWSIDESSPKVNTEELSWKREIPITESDKANMRVSVGDVQTWLTNELERRKSVNPVTLRKVKVVGAKCHITWTLPQNNVEKYDDNILGPPK